MLSGIEYNKDYRALVISFFNEVGKTDICVKKLAQSDLFVWATSRERTPDIGCDGTYVRKLESDSPNRFRLEEMIYSLLSDEEKQRIYARNTPNAYAIDIEVEASINNEFPHPETAAYPVNLISIASMTSPDVILLTTINGIGQNERERMMREVNEYVSTAYDAQKWPRETYSLKYFAFNSEKNMLEAFFYDILPRLPLICGWNVLDFDWQTLVNRAEKCGVDVVRKLLSKSLVGQYRTPVHTSIINMIDALVKFRPIKAPENHQLDYISKRSVGIGKMKQAYASFYEFQKDTYSFVKYNIVDSILVRLIDMKHKLLHATYEIAGVTHAEVSKIFGPVFMTEMMMCQLFLRDGKHLPIRKKNMSDKLKYEGAYVMEPIPGFYELIACFDFKSMYPNLQMQFNMSTDSYIGTLKTVDVSKLQQGSFVVTKNDTIFDNTFDSAARRILVDLYGRRDAARTEINEIKQTLERNASQSA